MMKWTKCAIRFLRISRPGVRVPSIAPNNENPNLFSIGEGFGFFVFFGNENAAAELDCLIYNDPLGYADLILNGDPEEYLKNVAGSHGSEI